MASLTNTKIKDTYDGLLKTTDNDALGGTYKLITDGLGNSSNVYLGTGGNVGIGTSNPSAKLDVNGTSIFRDQLNIDPTGDPNNVLSLNARNSNDYANLMFRNSGGSANWAELVATPNTLAFETSGSERMRINSNGNVGIGTSSPSRVLHIVDSSVAAIQLENSSEADSFIDFKNPSRTFRVGYDDSADLFKVAVTNFNDNSLVVNSSGNVGIGTSSPEDMLHISTTGTAALKFDGNGTGSARIHSTFGILNLEADDGNENSASYITFKNHGSEKMRIDSSGNVGIAESDPSGYWGQASNLVLNDSNTGLTIKSTTTGNGRIVFTDTKSSTSGLSDGGMIHYDHSGDSMRLHTNGSERMRIESDGDVCIGRTSAFGGTLLSLERAFSGNTAITINTTTTGTTYVPMKFLHNGTLRGYIATSTTSTSYNTSSDYRLKENVVDMTGALDRIEQLQPKRFNFISDAETTVDGFIAHEVQSVIPEAITGEKDAVDDEGNPQYQGIDQSKIVPLLVGAIKELKAEIETLKSQINS